MKEIKFKYVAEQRFWKTNGILPVSIPDELTGDAIIEYARKKIAEFLMSCPAIYYVHPNDVKAEIV